MGVDGELFFAAQKTAVPSIGEGFGKYTTVVCRIGNRKSLDLDPPFMANQGSGLRYGSRYPLRYAFRPVGMYVVGSGTQLFVVLGGGSYTKCGMNANADEQTPTPVRGSVCKFLPRHYFVFFVYFFFRG